MIMEFKDIIGKRAVFTEKIVRFQERDDPSSHSLTEIIILEVLDNRRLKFRYAASEELASCLGITNPRSEELAFSYNFMGNTEVYTFSKLCEE